MEGRYHEFSREWPKAIEIYRTLIGFFPDNLEYGLRLAASQAAGGSGKDALATIEDLRNLPAPARDDARIDLAEANAAAVIGDFKRSEAAAAQAVTKGRAQGTQLVVAQARSRQGWAMERLGQSNDAAAALAEAHGLFTAAGDRMGAATTLQSTGHLLYDKGNFTGARKAYEDASPCFAPWAIRPASRLRSTTSAISTTTREIWFTRGNITSNDCTPIARSTISPDWPAAWEILPTCSTAWAIFPKP